MDHEFDASPPSSPPAKRQRVLACRRCRHRKQRCVDGRPCKNCRKSGEECIPVEPAPRLHMESEYVKALEQRIAELESLHPQQSLDHIRAPELSREQNPAQLPCLDSSDVRHSEAAAVLQSLNQNGGQAAAQPPPSTPHANPAKSPSETEPQPSPPGLGHAAICHGYIANDGDEDEAGLDHMILGLVASPTLSREDPSPVEAQHAVEIPRAVVLDGPQYSEQMMVQTYRQRAHCQYPFFHFPTFVSWRDSWKTSTPETRIQHAWQGFFVYMIYSCALLLLPRIGRSDSRAYYKHGLSLLPSVLHRADPVLTVQAYLVLAMHALHSSSTERIISLASTAMRCCVQAQLHLHETEQPAFDGPSHLENQIRRRVFWCAYKLDRAIASAFGLPMSIPDSMITAKMYANVGDEDLLEVASSTPVGAEIKDSAGFTRVSTSLHITQCRRIQSEIMGYTLRGDYATKYASSYDWRIHILAELDNWKSQVQKFSDPASVGYTSHRWLAMIYHYTLLLLYRPTEDSIPGPAGDWSVQASSQACLMFRKFQMDRQIAHPWLGLLVQFQAGVTLLYCFWATPPKFRTDNFDSPDVPDALRACSNILAIMADRWPKAECLRDVFDLLAREVPLVDRTTRPVIRISNRSAAAIREQLPQVRALVVHRPILRMIEKMINEDCLRPGEDRIPGAAMAPTPAQHMSAIPQQPRPLQRTPSPGTGLDTPSASLGFELPFSAPQWSSAVNNSALDLRDLDADVPSFPGMFDLDSVW